MPATQETVISGLTAEGPNQRNTLVSVDLPGGAKPALSSACIHRRDGNDNSFYLGGAAVVDTQHMAELQGSPLRLWLRIPDREA